MNELQTTETTIGLLTSDSFKLTQRVATMLSMSTMVPNEYRGERGVSNCIIALDIASRMNIPPLMVVQNLHIIEGRPSWSSKFLISTINSGGKFEGISYKLEEGESLKDMKYTDIYGKNTYTVNDDIKNMKCTAFSKKKGSSEILTGTTITIEMAIKEGWYFKKRSKWPTMAVQMLKYRAAAFWVSTFAPEVSMGMSTEEEMIDIREVKASEYEIINTAVEPEKDTKIGIEPEAEIKTKQGVEKSLVKKKRICDVCKLTELNEEEARESLDKNDKIICSTCVEKAAKPTPEEQVEIVLISHSLSAHKDSCVKYLKAMKVEGETYLDRAIRKENYEYMVKLYIISEIAKIDTEMASKLPKDVSIKDCAEGLLTIA